MKNYTMGLLLALMMVTACSGNSEDAMATETPIDGAIEAGQGSTAEVQQALNALLANYAKSVDELDIELAEKVFSQSAETSFIHPRGHQKGWENIKKAFYLGAMGNFSKRDLRLKNISIRTLSNDSAWAEFYWVFDAVFIKNGKAIKTIGRETQIYKKGKDGWKIVHVHYSGPATQREGEGF